MPELAPAGFSRRSLLSAAALLGGGAAVTSGLAPAAAVDAPTTPAPTGIAARTALHASADPSRDREVWGFSQRDPVYGVNGWGSHHPTVTIVDRAANVLYGGAGEFGSDGLTATNIDTGKIDASIPEQELGGVWGLAVAGKMLFFSASSGDGMTIYAHPTTSPVSDPLSYKKLGAPGQSVTETWAATSKHAVFGAVPGGTTSSGVAPAGSTGIVGIIDAATQTMSTRQDLLPGHYVSHLTTIGSTVYGTTRPAADDAVGAAAPLLFALDPATGTVLRSQEMPKVHFTGIVVLEDLLYVATASDVLEVDPETWSTIRTLPLIKPDTNRSPRAAAFFAVPHTKRLVHRNSHGESVISTRTGQVSYARYGATDSFFTDARNTVWVRKDAGHGPLKMDQAMANGAPYRGPWISPFTDVATTRVFYKEIAWLAEVGVSTGWAAAGDTRVYRPDAKVTREIMAAFLYRLAGSPEYTAPETSPFTDVPTTRGFYKQIAWLADAGISTGWPAAGGTRVFRLAQNVTRGQMAAFMYRLAGKPDYKAPATSPFKDAPTGHVFYTEIAWLAAQGISAGWSTSTGKVFKPEEAVLRDQMAAFMYRLAATAL